MGQYICSSDEEYSSILNVHKLGLSSLERKSLGTLAADAEFLDEIQIRLAVMISDVAQ
jgi:hypothetical protein